MRSQKHVCCFVYCSYQEMSLSWPVINICFFYALCRKSVVAYGMDICPCTGDDPICLICPSITVCMSSLLVLDDVSSWLSCSYEVRKFPFSRSSTNIIGAAAFNFTTSSTFSCFSVTCVLSLLPSLFLSLL